MAFKSRGGLVRMADAALRVFRTRLVIYMHSLGFTDDQMADALDVSTRTIRTYRRFLGLPVNRKKRRNKE